MRPSGAGREVTGLPRDSRRGRLSRQAAEHLVTVTRKLQPGLTGAEARADGRALFHWLAPIERERRWNRLGAPGGRRPTSPSGDAPNRPARETSRLLASRLPEDLRPAPRPGRFVHVVNPLHGRRPALTHPMPHHLRATVNTNVAVREETMARTIGIVRWPWLLIGGRLRRRCQAETPTPPYVHPAGRRS